MVSYPPPPVQGDPTLEFPHAQDFSLVLQNRWLPLHLGILLVGFLGWIWFDFALNVVGTSPLDVFPVTSQVV